MINKSNGLNNLKTLTRKDSPGKHYSDNLKLFRKLSMDINYIDLIS